MAQSQCPLCGGTGWRLVERVDANDKQVSKTGAQETNAVAPGGHKPTWAIPCECTSSNRRTHAVARARIPRRFQHCDFENFDTDVWGTGPEEAAWDRSLKDAKILVQAFANNYPAGTESGLLLMGPCGVGKTHLAISVLHQLMLRGHDVLFYDYRDLLKELQASYHPDSPISHNGILGAVLRAEVLLLDDVGVGRPSEWVVEMVGHILTKRYNDTRVTLLTTSYVDRVEQSEAPVRLPGGQYVAPPVRETLSDRIGVRVRSRLYEMCRTVEINSDDYRRAIRQARHIGS